jgi:energy-coupling factor transport system ATP-binding protein
MQALKEEGKTIVIVSHDIEFCAAYTDRCGLFFGGRLVTLKESKEFFRENYFYTTVVSRICRGILPDAVTLQDL